MSMLIADKQLIKEIKSSMDDPYGYQLGQQLEEKVDEAEMKFNAKTSKSDMTKRYICHIYNDTFV